MTNTPETTRNKLQWLLWPLALLALVLSLVVTVEMKAQQRLEVDLAELNHARYGLLNPSDWSTQIGDLVERRLSGKSWSATDIAEAREAVGGLLYQVINEARKTVEAEMPANDQGGLFGSLGGGFQRMGVEFCLGQFEQQVPLLAHRLSRQLADPNGQSHLAEFIQQQISGVIATSFAPINRAAIVAIEQRNQCLGDSCQSELRAAIAAAEKSVRPKAIALLMLSIAAVLLSLFTALHRWQIVPPIIACVALLIGGVAAPMLSIEAQISQLNVALLGDSLSFSNQILFYQNKSIADVAVLLLQSDEFQLALVAVLVVMFSVIFPLIKLIASAWLAFGKPMNRVSEFFALKSSKWSLADVFVVALFMTFLGFSGVIDRQLLPLAQDNAALQVLTTNGSELQWGFSLFFAFCLLSFALSVRLGRHPITHTK